MSRRTFVLCRDRQWICAPADHDQTAAFCPGLTVAPDMHRAWLCQDLNLAHDRALILKLVYGWSTEIRALVSDDDSR